MTTYPNVLPTTYSSKATAKRGAIRAGLTNFECEQNSEGRWVVIDCTEVDTLFTLPGTPVVDMEANDVAAMIEEAKASAPENEEAHAPDLSEELGARDKKGFRRRSVDPQGVTGRVHDICHRLYQDWIEAGQNPDTKPKRKDYMAAVLAQGVAFYTARTQIQKFLQGGVSR